jgi:N,N'-diacetyllegionaminate synthase
MKRFQIGGKAVGDGAPCLLVAEVALAHEGSLGMAHAYIDAAADAGADVVKFQTHIAAAESTPEEQFRVKVFPQDATRYDYWERTAFTEDQWRELKTHAERRNMEFLSSPFSTAAVQLLRRIGVKGWKIGSGETNNPLLLDAVAQGKEPVLLSTGMSYWNEIDAVVQALQSHEVPVMVMQCTTSYPCPPKQLGLHLISEFGKRYGVPIGFSDHSGEIAPGLAAVTLGAKALELHVTWHKKAFGPDVRASLTLEEFAELAKGVRIIEEALATQTDKDDVAQGMGEMRRLFTKGLVAKEDMEAATQIELRHLEARKPCLGIPAVEYRSILGKRVKHSISKGSRITLGDIE